jgi:hypothetical protein
LPTAFKKEDGRSVLSVCPRHVNVFPELPRAQSAPDGEIASEMVRQSPLVLAKPRFPADDPRWTLPGYFRTKEPMLWKRPRTLADRLWDLATDPVRSDIPPRDDDDLLGRGRSRSPVLVEVTRMLWTRSSLKGRVVREDAEAAQSSAETWSPNKGTAIFTDGSKLVDGSTGCAAVWKGPDGWWQGHMLFMGRNKEVFDAELYAIWIGLKAAKDNTEAWAAGPRAVTIFTDALNKLCGHHLFQRRVDSLRQLLCSLGVGSQLFIRLLFQLHCLLGCPSSILSTRRSVLLSQLGHQMLPRVLLLPNQTLDE